MNRVNKRVSDMVSPLYHGLEDGVVYRFYVYEGGAIAGEDFEYEDDAIDFAQDLVDRGTDYEVTVERRVYATPEDASKDYPVDYEDIWSSEDYKVSDSRVSDMTKPVHLRGYAKMRRDERRAKNAELRNEDFEEKEKDEKQEEVNDSYRVKDAVADVQRAVDELYDCRYEIGGVAKLLAPSAKRGGRGTISITTNADAVRNNAHVDIFKVENDPKAKERLEEFYSDYANTELKIVGVRCTYNGSYSESIANTTPNHNWGERNSYDMSSTYAPSEWVINLDVVDNSIADSCKIKDGFATMYNVGYNEDPYKLARRVAQRGTVSLSSRHQRPHDVNVNEDTVFRVYNDGDYKYDDFMSKYGVNDSRKIKDADEADTDTDDVIDGLLIITFKDGSQEDGLNAIKEHANEQGDGYETYEVKEQDGKVGVDMCAQTSDPNGFVKELLKAWGVLDAVADVDFKKSDLMEEAEQQEEVSDSRKIKDSTYGTSFTLTNPVNDYNAALDYLQADDMTRYLNNDLNYLGLSHLEGKIKEIKWVLEDEQTGYIVLYTTEPLVQEDLDKISEWISGQCSDGLGEGFEQQDFASGEDFEEYEDEDGYTQYEEVNTMASFDWETNDYKLKLYDSARVKDSGVKDSIDFVAMRREVASTIYSLEKLGEPVTVDSVADYLHINEYEADPAMLDRWYDIIEDEVENQYEPDAEDVWRNAEDNYLLGRRADSRIKDGCGEDAELVDKVNNTDILRDNKNGGVYVWVNGQKKKFSTKKDAEAYIKKTFNEDGTPKK